jgi:hypothetical protein
VVKSTVPSKGRRFESCRIHHRTRSSVGRAIPLPRVPRRVLVPVAKWAKMCTRLNAALRLGFGWRRERWRFESDAAVVGWQRFDEFMDRHDQILNLGIVDVEPSFKF